MKPQRLIIFVAAFFLLTGFSWSDGARRFLELKGPAGSGQVEIEPMQARGMPRLRNVAINVYGLQPNSVYSVWLADEEGRRSPAGVKTNHFRTDASGKGRYVTTAYEDVLDDWRYLEVMLHPNGNPADTGSATSALKGDLVYGTHS